MLEGDAHLPVGERRHLSRPAEREGGPEVPTGEGPGHHPAALLAFEDEMRIAPRLLEMDVPCRRPDRRQGHPHPRLLGEGEAPHEPPAAPLEVDRDGARCAAVDHGPLPAAGKGGRSGAAGQERCQSDDGQSHGSILHARHGPPDRPGATV